MVEIDKYYRIHTLSGERTIKAQQESEPGVFHGIYSLSDYQSYGDNMDAEIPSDSPEATELQAQAWEAWYNHA
jgi:hypothetical protein